MFTPVQLTQIFALNIKLLKNSIHIILDQTAELFSISEPVIELFVKHIFMRMFFFQWVSNETGKFHSAIEIVDFRKKSYIIFLKIVKMKVWLDQ